MNMYKVTQDDVEKFRGTHNKCFEWLLKNQSQSTAWAIQNEGWKIEPAERTSSQTENSRSFE